MTTQPSRPCDETAPAGTEETRVVILAPTGRDAALAVSVLTQAQVPCTACSSTHDLLDSIRRGSGPAVVTSEVLTEAVVTEIKQALADQPKWSDLPLVIISGRDGPPRHLWQLLERQSATLLRRPLNVPTYITTVRAAMQNRLRQYEVRDLLIKLRDRARQLQRLALQLTQTEERERQRLADILHDDLQQLLAGAKFHVDLLPGQAEKGRLEQAADALSDLLGQAIQTSRRLSHELSPPTLQQHGLVTGLQWLASRQQQLHGLDVALEIAPEAEPTDPRVRVFLYRCAQELLFNVVKHAGVDEAQLKLSVSGDDLVLCVQDAGRGYEVVDQSNGQASEGLGLISIRERADLLGGRFEARPGEQGGSRFSVIVPQQAVSDPQATSEQMDPSTTASPAEHGARDGEQPLRVLLADDHQVMRNGLRALLQADEDIAVVAEADNGLEAVRLASQLEPDVVLMDVSMPRLNGIEATRRIKSRHPDVRVVGLSMYDDRETAMKMRAAGADQYLLKTGSSDHLRQVVRGATRRGSNGDGG